MPYASSNKSSSGVARGGISRKGKKRYKQSRDDIASLAGFNNNAVFGQQNPGNFVETGNALADLAQQLLGGGGNDSIGIPSPPQNIDPGQILQPKPKPKMPNATDQFINQLMDVAQSQFGLNQADYETALQDSADQIKKAFASEIGAVRASNAGARKDAKNANKQLGAMYRALQRSYNRTAKGEDKAGTRLSNKVTNVANQAQDTIQNSANDALNQQAALAKGLGVEAAIPEVTAAQQSNVQKQVEGVVNRGQRAANDVLKYSGNQHRFLVRGGQNARLEGTNRQADMLSQLQDILAANRGKIADLRGQRSMSLADNAGKIASSQAQSQQDAYNNLFNQLMDIGKFKTSVENSNADNKLARQKFRLQRQQASSSSGSGNKFMSAIPSSISDIGTIVSQASHPQKVQSIVNQLLGSPEFVQGRFTTGAGGKGDTLQLTPFKAREMAENRARAAGLSQSDSILAGLAAMRALQS